MDDDHRRICVRSECVHQRVIVLSRDCPAGGIRHQGISQPVIVGICPGIVIPEISGSPRPADDIGARDRRHIPAGTRIPVLCMDNRIVDKPVIIKKRIRGAILDTNALAGDKIIPDGAACHCQSGVL